MTLRDVSRWATRSGITIVAICGSFLLAWIIAATTHDLVTSSRQSDQQALQTGLEAQLAAFALATRDKDGSSMLENPEEFSRMNRAMSPVSLNRSFYAYLLNRGNARQFAVEKINFDWPRPCLLSFSSTATAGSNAPKLDACFAVVPADTTGRYVYFAIRFPTSTVRRHQSGTSIADADYVALNFSGPRQAGFVLTYETPRLAIERYPSFVGRFDGVHEIAAFYSNRIDRPLRQVNAQAFERTSDADGRNYVTLVGRIDAALLDGQGSDTVSWPGSWIKSLSIGVDVYQWDEAAAKSTRRFSIEPNRQGTAVMSLEQAYLLSVPSRAKLEIRSTKAAGSKLLWSSDQIAPAIEAGGGGATNGEHTWWAAAMDHLIEPKVKLVTASLRVELVGTSSTYEAVLTSTPPPLPDYAKRALLGFMGALVLSGFLLLLSLVALLRLRKITAVTYGLIVGRGPAHALSTFRRGPGEIASLGRVLDVLVRRSATRGKARDRHIQIQQSQIKLDRELVKQRQAILDALGHEIRSPLQSLLTQTKENPELRTRLERMRRAVEGLYNATSVETGLLSGRTESRKHDLARYLSQFIQNLNEVEPTFIYRGPLEGVVAEADDINLETVLDHLFNNAREHRLPGTPIEVELSTYEGQVQLTVFNYGPRIADDRLESIFNFGVSSFASNRNQGQGLFVVRSLLIAMRARICAKNRENGVAMIIHFSVSTSNLSLHQI